jgi:hypothetical protein
VNGSTRWEEQAMSFTNAFASMPSAALWVVVGALCASVALYVVRVPAHRALRSLTRALQNAMRLAANSMIHAERRLEMRNREVLLAAGREASERIIEREFERVEVVVQRDMASIPSLDREMKEKLAALEDDYRHSTEVPPAPPSWTGVVEAVANVPAKGDPMVATILEQIHGSLVKAQDKAIEEYRTATAERHVHLRNMMPEWRKLQEIGGQINKNAVKLFERSAAIDRHMDDYENILKKSDRAVRALSTSSLHQFLISALVLIIAFGGAVINFHLIARPMAEMVGGNSSIGGFKTSDIAALVIILVEISIGIFMMESLRVTRLFPIIGALPDKLRVRMIWITFGILFSLASVEAGLAYMREILLMDELATNALLRDGAMAAGASDFVWITTAAQMGMGFILPFALVFATIPLEVFIFSMRTVSGMAASAVLRGAAVILRVIGGVTHHAGELAINIYDIFIFAPLWLEDRFGKAGRSGQFPSATHNVKGALP